MTPYRRPLHDPKLRPVFEAMGKIHAEPIDDTSENRPILRNPEAYQAMMAYAERWGFRIT